MTVTRTAGVCLILAGIALAEPVFRVGTKLTWHAAAGTVTYNNGDSVPLVEISSGDEYAGPAVEASYGPFWGLSGRIDIAQVGILSDGQMFRLFPTLGLDLLAEPPLDWRVKPYLWAGTSLVGYNARPGNSMALSVIDYGSHWRAGLGGKFRLTRRTEFFAETQLFAYDKWWDGPALFPDGSFMSGGPVVDIIGLRSVEFGARFAFGK